VIFFPGSSSPPVLCDGAMGTLLYAKGVFINRSYDELNLSQPDMIRAGSPRISAGWRRNR